MSAKSRYELTGAEKKSIGFDYQYYYFLLQLLRFRAGQTIGLEVKDDVHISLADGTLVLLQLKHSIRKKASGEIENMTERDGTLWKTISNWIKVIQDPVEGRKLAKEQKSFINSTRFVLVSNKSHGTRNRFFSQISDLLDDILKVDEFKEYLQKLLDETTDSESNKDLKQYISELLNLNNSLLVLFVTKLEFRLEEDDLIGLVKKEIESFMIPSEKVEDVYNALNSTVRDNIYFMVKSGDKIEISHEDFISNYRNCFGRMKELKRRNVDLTFTDDYLSQPFIVQLLDIRDITKTESDQIIHYTKLRLLLYNNMKAWLNKGELTGPQRDQFDQICLTHWNNSFRSAHARNRRELISGRTSADIENDIVEAANICLNELRRTLLKIEDEELDIEISNGQFYQLANDLRIGWHLKWENKYL
jgi:hypothetical protein